jgi:hypothetical protein
MRVTRGVIYLAVYLGCHSETAICVKFVIRFWGIEGADRTKKKPRTIGAARGTPPSDRLLMDLGNGTAAHLIRAE